MYTECRSPQRRVHAKDLCSNCYMRHQRRKRPAPKRDFSVRLSAYQERINAIKSASGCVDCGFNETPIALEFDHLPQFEKAFNIGRAGTRRWEAVLAEIAKCEVVCCNCHAIRTHTRLREQRKGSRCA